MLSATNLVTGFRANGLNGFSIHCLHKQKTGFDTTKLHIYVS